MESQPKAKRPPDETLDRTRRAFETLVEGITPWLLDLGGWIFGALIALNLLVLASLVTVGPVDGAVLIATLCLALALPPDVAGFLLLRLLEDLNKVRLDQVAADAFAAEGFDRSQFESAAAPASLTQKRSRKVLAYSYSMLNLSAVLTVAGLTATLWHMSWWIAVAFLAATFLSIVLVMVAMSGERRQKGPAPGATPAP